MLQGCGSKAGRADNSPSSETSGAEVPQTGITAEMAYEGVNNYCHSHYDWSVAEENPDVMYVRMGEESDTAYQVIFRSYTGSFVYFNVDKASGMTTMKEVVPNVKIASAGIYCVEEIDRAARQKIINSQISRRVFFPIGMLCG